jgi:hypothetical protein
MAGGTPGRECGPASRQAGRRKGGGGVRAFQSCGGADRPGKRPLVRPREGRGGAGRRDRPLDGRPEVSLAVRRAWHSIRKEYGSVRCPDKVSGGPISVKSVGGVPVRPRETPAPTSARRWAPRFSPDINTRTALRTPSGQGGTGPAIGGDEAGCGGKGAAAGPRPAPPSARDEEVGTWIERRRAEGRAPGRKMPPGTVPGGLRGAHVTMRRESRSAAPR